MCDLTQIGALFMNSGVAAGQILQVVAPANNLKGIYIRTCTLTVTASGGGATLYANPAAPASVGDANSRPLLNLYNSGGTSTAVLPYPLFVPPGIGLWVGASVASGVAISYDLAS